jgi:predicted nucleic acid-binding protein
MTAADVHNALDALASVLEPIEPHFLWRPKSRDADDDMVLEAAVNGRADAIATFYARDFAGVADEFGLSILTPRAILRRM